LSLTENVDLFNLTNKVTSLDQGSKSANFFSERSGAVERFSQKSVERSGAVERFSRKNLERSGAVERKF
jgi:hypothetical protein